MKRPDFHHCWLSPTLQIKAAAAVVCSFEILLHPLYSYYLAPSKICLFPKLQTELRGTHFDSHDDVIGAVEAFLNR